MTYREHSRRGSTADHYAAAAKEGKKGSRKRNAALAARVSDGRPASRLRVVCAGRRGVYCQHSDDLPSRAKLLLTASKLRRFASISEPPTSTTRTSDSLSTLGSSSDENWLRTISSFMK